MPKIPKDNRDKLWAKLESDIQETAKKKDKRFRFKGKWKKFVRKQRGYKVFAVDGDWVRHNLSVTFGHGGHGFVHEFIPLDEIWITTHHYRNKISKIMSCGCEVETKDQKVSKKYFDSTVHHEITECNVMKKGIRFWKAHHIALVAERVAGLLADPFIDKPKRRK